MNLAELLVIPASMYPEQEMLRFEGTGTPYEVLQDRAMRAAGALAGLGVGAGDRVAVLQTNTPAVLDVLFGAVALGGVFVPLNYRVHGDDLRGMLGVATPRVLCVGARYLDLAREAASSLPEPPMLVMLDAQVDGLPSLDALADEAEPCYPEEVADDDLAVMMFTSGTTAAAKAVMLAHEDLVNFVFSTTEPADGADRGAVLLAAPLYHIAGLSAALAATFAGRRIVMMRQFEAEAWLRLAASEHVTHAFLVPTMMKRLLAHPAFGEADLSSLEIVSYGAAPMPLGVIRQAIEQFPPTVGFINAFGQTETTSTVLMLGPDDHRLDGSPEDVERKVRRLSSIGRPLPGVEVAILDPFGQAVPQGEVGEIAIRTDRVMRGYYGQTEATNATLHDGWLHTRDLGWIDEAGYVFLAGRTSDMIIRGGENIAPDEIEQVLHAHPDVDEVAVIGLPDEEWGERVAAVVVAHHGHTVEPESLIEYVHHRLASYKKPDVVIFADELPRNSVGKLVRSELRARYGTPN
ncbi:MAG: AMP-binding protein [Chloroflexi bacterium]|nr:AMP-binding protein [Chloroflexota bacterium]